MLQRVPTKCMLIDVNKDSIDQMNLKTLWVFRHDRDETNPEWKRQWTCGDVVVVVGKLGKAVCKCLLTERVSDAVPPQCIVAHAKYPNFPCQPRTLYALQARTQG